MDPHRPPRSTRPSPSQNYPAPPSYPERTHFSPPNVSFHTTERGDRSSPLADDTPTLSPAASSNTFAPPSTTYSSATLTSSHGAAAASGTSAAHPGPGVGLNIRQRATPSAYQALGSPTGGDAESAGGDYAAAAALADRVGRKKSLVRPDREKIEPGHRQWHYRSRVAQLEDESPGRVDVMPSTTGNFPQREPLRRGRSILARDEDVQESGLAIFKRGATLRRKLTSTSTIQQQQEKKAGAAPRRGGCMSEVPGPKGPWMAYCYALTFLVPNWLLRTCKISTPEAQRAWREKMGLLSIIAVLMTGVGFLTFGFTITVCSTPPHRYATGTIQNSSVIIHGYAYNFTDFHHPAVPGAFNGQANPLYEGNWGAASADITFMFQNTGGSCQSFMSRPATSSITNTTGTLDWYFPCNIFNQNGTSPINETGYGQNTNCHVSSQARNGLAAMKPLGQVYYTWENVTNSTRNLAVFESSVLDLDLLQWLSRTEVEYPTLFDEMAHANGTFNEKDLTMMFLRTNQRTLGQCLQELVMVGFIDTNSIGCVASDVVLYVSLVFIIGVVSIRFIMAVLFAWFFSWKLGNFPRETYEQRMQRAAVIENWTDDIYRPAPSQYRPNVNKQGQAASQQKRRTFLPSTSRFTPAESAQKVGSAGVGVGGRPLTTYGMLDAGGQGNYYKRATSYGMPALPRARGTPPDSPAGYRQSRSTMSFANESSARVFADSPCPFPLGPNVVPQPPADHEPFNFPLAHTLCLVTAYSESVEGLRTTIDSLATTDYPNSHKVILVIADGMVKGAGNSLTTPEICLGMMREFVVPPEDVEPHSYVAIADGHKRHNMAKVYAGFYAYDDATVERSKQQRVPMVLVAKVGNPLEARDAKPGNRGKRDSQIVLMAFLQKVMFDERMTTFEYEFFNSLWRATGVSPDRYELVLCVDADTKVFPDSLTRMVSCMVVDEEIMGLCGETKIANKAETFVTMMQVFEYYISHHMTKAFESMFGGVTCLPGCFSMYRIKAPKGATGYWVPILANPDIVEHYSENVVDTLHKKNLLLLGEDRYLTTLMLKTFPKRKNIFCPQAVCKTVVPDTFRVLLSQRRRWINSTVHNLAELLLVRDLCGTFCFSMQFVVGMELAGTLVLPAAISFTLYLIIISIIPGGTNTTIPLVLLAIVLGLPGVLIVITSRKVSYVGWMLVYLLSLPIWNGILPAYSFWHFDDFSWGQTRMVAGDKGGNHGDKEGEFDSTHIVMKRWVEFERDRRLKSGSQSRDESVSYEKRAESVHYSMNSTSDNYHPPSQQLDTSTMESANFSTRQRHDSAAVLMLPTPLAVNNINNRPPTNSSTAGLSRSSEELMYDAGSASNQRLVSSPDHDRSLSPERRYGAPLESQVARAAGGAAVLRQGAAPNQYPGETQNPFYTQPQSAAYDDPVGYAREPQEEVPPQSTMRPQYQQLQYLQQQRGFSLADNGPVPSPEGVRRVSRAPGRRASSQAPHNRYSPGPGVSYNLPPGAAPPNPNGYGNGF